MTEIIDGFEQVVMSIGSEKRKKLATKRGIEKVELDKILYASSLAKAPPNKTKEEIKAIDTAKANPVSPAEAAKAKIEASRAKAEIVRATNLNSIKTHPPSKNVTIAYPLDNGTLKVVDMGDKYPSTRAKLTKKELDNQFRVGASWAEGNLSTGQTGFVRMPNGTVYEVSNSSRSARVVKD